MMRCDIFLLVYAIDTNKKVVGLNGAYYQGFMYYSLKIVRQMLLLFYVPEMRM